MKENNKIIEPVPSIPLNGGAFSVSFADAREIVEAHIKASLNHRALNVRSAAQTGMEPYKIAVAMALNDLGFGDLLTQKNRVFGPEDIGKLEEHFPFLIFHASSIDDAENSSAEDV